MTIWYDLNLFVNIEIGIRIRLLKEEPDVKYYSKLEQKLLEKFKDVRSDSTLELRNKLHHVSNTIFR